MKRIKVNGVENFRLAESLIGIGVNVVSATSRDISSWSNHDRLRDHLCVYFDLAKQAEDQCIDFLNSSPNFRYVEFGGHVLPSKELVHRVAADSQVFFSQISVDHDDDPAWILSRHLDEEYAVHIDPIFELLLFCDVRNGWEYLLAADQRQLSLEDINSITGKHRTLLTLDFSTNNLADILSALPNINGIALPTKPSVSHDLSFTLEQISRFVPIVTSSQLDDT